ncbi:hypothetical protein D3C86_1108040 [compost metagenome]
MLPPQATYRASSGPNVSAWGLDSCGCVADVMNGTTSPDGLMRDTVFMPGFATNRYVCPCMVLTTLCPSRTSSWNHASGSVVTVLPAIVRYTGPEIAPAGTFTRSVLRSELTSPTRSAGMRPPPSAVKWTSFSAVTREKLLPTSVSSWPISCLRGFRKEIENGTSGKSTWFKFTLSMAIQRTGSRSDSSASMTRSYASCTIESGTSPGSGRTTVSG